MLLDCFKYLKTVYKNQRSQIMYEFHFEVKIYNLLKILAD